MKWQSEESIEQGCYCPEPKTETTSYTTVARLPDRNSSTSNIPQSSLYSLANNERKALEAYKLGVEEKRTAAIETARRRTFL